MLLIHCDSLIVSLFLVIIIIYLYMIYVYMHVHICVTVNVWTPEGRIQGLVLSFYHMLQVLNSGHEFSSASVLYLRTISLVRILSSWSKN